MYYDQGYIPPCNNILVVSGSVNPITIHQIEYGESIGFSKFTLTPEQKMNPSYPNSTECEAFACEVAAELERNKRVIVSVVKDMPADAAAASLVADNIAEITLRILDRARVERRCHKCATCRWRGRVLEHASVESLAIFGEDTLRAVLSKMCCDEVMPIAEIFPGVVAAKIISERQNCVLITKLCGLGEKDILSRIEEFLF
jgi:uncharacterized protein YgbK (DUF1537 family)